MRLDSTAPVMVMSGVGPAQAKRLETLGIMTVQDVRNHLPHRYVEYPPARRAVDLGFRDLESFEGVVSRVDLLQLPGKRTKITATLRDETGSVAAVWLRAGRPPTVIREGARLAVSGPITSFGGPLTFDNPDYELADHPPLNTRRIVPVYPLTAGISQPFMRLLARHAMEGLPPLDETLPVDLLAAERLLGLDRSYREIHAPTSMQGLEEARLRLAFDELLPIQILVLRRRAAFQSIPAAPIQAPWTLLAEFRRSLPFSLTGDQQRALSAILDDVGRPVPMVRLLQGEVGSGKTVVAAMALLAAIANGGQGALMAPTEILAEQHFRTLTRLFGEAGAVAVALGRPLRVSLLTGALSRAERSGVRDDIASGTVDVVVGTHALIESDVDFQHLMLAVVDEQHRFGVNQRVAMRRKGENPHLLVMTATPIPRTLALTLYGDLDLSLIEELPPGRQPVETVLVRPETRAVAYERIRQEAEAGHQAFVICPLVEGSETTEARAATVEFERLRQGELAGLRLALLHGRMRSAAKDETMLAFSQGDLDVLVATSVVEVGVDVPNATVMVIEGAERFGLAQLHQFRGRIGRGNAPSICFLVAESPTGEAIDRLSAVVRSTSGLDLAEEDLRIRGPGEYYGLRQSGFPPLRVARFTDLELIQRTRGVASGILKRDPGLSREEHGGLRRAVQAFDPGAGEAN
jgi:ATP-dependent DNA helicase RecG